MAPTSFSMFCLILTISAFTSLQSASSIPSSAACDITTYPHFCRSSILPRHGSATIHDYCRFTIPKSLSVAHRLSSLINSHLARTPSLSAPAARALNDCELLSDLNIDYLSKVGTALNSSQTLLDAQVDEFHSLLSARVFETRSGRRVVQDAAGVFINDMVIVSKDGTGNFTTITDALGAAPKGKNVNDGYFLIYITAGSTKNMF
ncbi:putative pectinesterase/pectinesterase inhibitor 41 [Acorus calamus]|uniref:Pectinesterase/pectinesterase inhibitor 41 n=1 Tax=Acorus calamus TaxID=4465 RepID=A0AAV9CVA8_ACOCL|nr:putative pectinesterase/pectinesterase inhibitor 41 [Acorus calamus]